MTKKKMLARNMLKLCRKVSGHSLVSKSLHIALFIKTTHKQQTFSEHQQCCSAYIRSPNRLSSTLHTHF